VADPLDEGEVIIRRHVLVSGRVQGVFFRDSCRREAVTRGVWGWIANRDDGAVEAIFEGPSRAVEAVVDWCRMGPVRAEVTQVRVTEEEPRGGRGFRVI
jgi:acylphosphatase